MKYRNPHSTANQQALLRDMKVDSFWDLLRDIFVSLVAKQTINKIWTDVTSSWHRRMLRII